MSEAEPRADIGEITRLLQEAGRGNPEAFDRLLPLVYEELKTFARRKLRLERDGHTLNATALVHEAYLRFVDQSRVEWRSRWHFYAVASQAMRRILIDHARRRASSKRGKQAVHVPLDDVSDAALGDLFDQAQADELVALDDALSHLAEFNPAGAQVVEYRFFGGLTYDEIADVMGVSKMTVRRTWMVAKAWLRAELGDDRADQTQSLLSRSGGADPGEG